MTRPLHLPTSRRVPPKKPLACASALAFALLGTLPLRANDLIVDTAGGPATFQTIGAAMLAAAPGDRILVVPGSYPAFQFERGVEVLGLGVTPAEVTIARVDFHVSVPNIDYDAVLSNVTVCGTSPNDAIAITGNELARGTLLLDGVRTCGGVFLGGDEGFQLVAQNSRFEPLANGGFLGAAFDFGGGRAELVDVGIFGWDAELSAPAGHGLRISAGAAVRATACTIEGGAGADLEAPGRADGGDGVTSLPWPGPVTLMLSGGTAVAGGSGAGLTGRGGAGVRARGLAGSLTLGDAAVTGGGGALLGAAWAEDQALALGFDPSLTLAGGSTPNGSAHGARSVRWMAGDELFVATDASIAATGRLTLSSWLEPAESDFGGLSGGLPPRTLATDQLALSVPGAPPSPAPRPRLWLVFQTRYQDPVSGLPAHSNPVVVRVDG
ncbi:MAG: hypothetical protein R3F49_07225 [Planctomycetota bacterium]